MLCSVAEVLRQGEGKEKAYACFCLFVTLVHSTTVTGSGGTDTLPEKDG